MTVSFKIDATGFQYDLHRDLATWWQATMHCWASNAQLWVPEGEAEQRAVRGEVDRVAEGFAIWTGMSNQDMTGVYRDPYGLPVSADVNRFWHDGQPDTADYTRLCVLLQPDSSLFNYYCEWTYYYVCKYPAASENAKPYLYDKIPWGGNVTFIAQKKLYVYHKEKATWEQARERCSSAHAQLVGPVDETAARAVAGALKRIHPRWGIWTSLSDQQETEVSFQTTTQGKKFTIETNGIDILYVFHNEYVSWHQARERCSAARTQLWAPGDEAEARAVRGKVNREFPYWSIWTGVNDLNTSGIYQTLEGQPLNAFQLKRFENQPEARDSGYRCLQLMYPNSSLFADTCDGELPYVCRYPAPTTPQQLYDVTLHKDDPNDPISSGWYKREKMFSILTDGMDIRYVYHDVWVTWHQARQRCSAARAQLWVPEYEAEARAVRGEVNPSEPFWWIWVGISDLDTSGVYQTLDGRNISAVYHKWRAGRPESRGGARRCAGLLPDSSLYDAGCDKNFPYVCRFHREVQT